MIVTTLDDIAWLTNLRGNDIEYNPLFFSYLIFHNKKDDQPYKVDLFVDKTKVAAQEVADFLQANNVTVHEYGQLKEKIAEYGASLQGKKVVVDEGNLNYQVYDSLKSKGFEMVAKDNICEYLKAAKN